MQKIRIVFIVFGAFFSSNAVAASFASNMHSGILITYALGLVFLCLGVFCDAALRYIPRIMWYLISACAVIAVVFFSFIYIYGSFDNVSYDEDAVIVLGSGIIGEKVPDNLRHRLDAAVDYASRNPGAAIVVSGGQGPDEDITESLAMEKYLVSAGIPESRIIKESLATSTAENFSYSKELLDDRLGGSYSVAFISSSYHIFRASALAETSGFDNITHRHAAVPFCLIIPNGIRECLGVVRQCVLSII